MIYTIKNPKEDSKIKFKYFYLFLNKFKIKQLFLVKIKSLKF